MSVRIEQDGVWLEGICPVEEAETLLKALLEGAAWVDLSRAGRLHTAVVQVLLAGTVAVAGVPSDPFTRRYLMPLFAARHRSPRENSA